MTEEQANRITDILADMDQKSGVIVSILEKQEARMELYEDSPTLLDQARDHDPDAPVDRQKHSTRAWVREYPTADAVFGMAPVPRSVVSGIAKDLYVLEKRFDARVAVLSEDYHNMRTTVLEMLSGEDTESQRVYDLLEAFEARIRELEESRTVAKDRNADFEARIKALEEMSEALDDRSRTTANEVFKGVGEAANKKGEDE